MPRFGTLSCAGHRRTVAGSRTGVSGRWHPDADCGRYRRHDDPAGTRLAAGRAAQIRGREGIPQRRLQGAATDCRGVPGRHRRPCHSGLLRRGRPGDRRARAPDQPALEPRRSGTGPRPSPATRQPAERSARHRVRGAAPGARRDGADQCRKGHCAGADGGAGAGHRPRRGVPDLGRTRITSPAPRKAATAISRRRPRCRPGCGHS